MPPQEVSFRRQKAVLWERVGYDSYGNPKVSWTPVELDVRWNDSVSQALDPQQRIVRVDATAIVNREIPIDSVMWLGTLATIPGVFPENTLCVVKTFNSTPDLKNRARFRVAGLMRLKDVLPNQGT